MANKVLVTGATGKLGQNIIRGLYKYYQIIVITRDLEKAKKLLPYGNLEYYYADLSSFSSIKYMCDVIVENNKSLYGIVNNAAVDIDCPLFDTKYKDFFTLLNTNTMAPYVLCKELLPLLINNGEGHVVNISSNLATRTIPGATEYSMSKASLESLTRSISAEFGKDGIYTNTVIIGGMGGHMTKSNAESSVFNNKEKYYIDCKMPLDKIPLRRQGEFKEFVSVIKFLLSTKSSYICGNRIVVDGGISSMS